MNNISLRSKSIVEMCRNSTEEDVPIASGTFQNKASTSRNDQQIILITVPPAEHFKVKEVNKIDAQTDSFIQTTSTIIDPTSLDEGIQDGFVNLSDGLLVSMNGVNDEDIISQESTTDNLDCEVTQNAVIFQNVVNTTTPDGEVSGPSKKRNRKPQSRLWQRELNKRLRELGQNYIGFEKDTETNKYKQTAPKPERKIGPPCDSNLCKKSKLRSCSSISEEKRIELFDMFWKMTWDQRKLYIVNHVEISSVKRRYTKNENSSRNLSLFYALSVDNKKISVCKKLFLSTVGLGEFQVRSWVKGAKHNMHESTMTRNETRSANLREERRSKDKEFLIKFFNDLETLPSHYCRKTSTKRYLDQTVPSKAALYKVYALKCQTEDIHVMSRWAFDDLFSENNLSLYQPKKDKCDLCCQYEVGNLEEQHYTLHVANKDRARIEKELDTELAEKEEAVVLMMDLEAVKVAPALNASALYYKTKLCCHNFTVMNIKTKHVMGFWFSEIESDLCGSTFASLTVDYVSRFTDNKLPVIIYSDGCTYQNRNNIMANALLFTAVTKNQTIIQKFLEPGHTQMPCDSIHSRIEAKIKECPEIYLPSTYLRITQEARENPFPYCAEWVNYDRFRDFSRDENVMYKSIRPGTQVVTEIRAIKYNRDGTIQYKCGFDEQWMVLPQRRYREKVYRVWPQLHLERRKLKAKKYKHLQELKFVIPQNCHLYYDNLPHL